MITNEVKNYSYRIYHITYVIVDKQARAFKDVSEDYATLAESVEQVKTNFAKAQKIAVDDIVECTFIKQVKKSISLADLL